MGIQGNIWTIFSLNFLLATAALVGYSYYTQQWVNKGPAVGVDEGWIKLSLTIAHVSLGVAGICVLGSLCTPPACRGAVLLPACVGALGAGLLYALSMLTYVLTSLMWYAIGISQYGLSTMCTAGAGLAGILAAAFTIKDFKKQCVCCGSNT